MPKVRKKKKSIKKIKQYTGEYGEVHPLSPREILFCWEYLKNEIDPVDAIYKAGYKPKNRATAVKMLWRFLAKPNISQFLYLCWKKVRLRDYTLRILLFFIVQKINANKALSALNKYYKISGKYPK